MTSLSQAKVSSVEAAPAHLIESSYGLIVQNRTKMNAFVNGSILHICNVRWFGMKAISMSSVWKVLCQKPVTCSLLSQLDSFMSETSLAHWLIKLAGCTSETTLLRCIQ